MYGNTRSATHCWGVHFATGQGGDGFTPTAAARGSSKTRVYNPHALRSPVVYQPGAGLERLCERVSIANSTAPQGKGAKGAQGAKKKKNAEQLDKMQQKMDKLKRKMGQLTDGGG
jgi:hypothetical protein